MSNDRKAWRVPTSAAMAKQLSYPTTLYSVPRLPDLSSCKDRKRLSGPNLLKFLKIAKRWKISAKDARLLLGGITVDYYRTIKTQPERRVLRQDQLTRVVLLVEIYESLNTVLGQKQAAKWVRLTTQEWPFRGLSPLSYLATRGVIAIYDLRNALAMSMTRSS